MAEIVLKEGYLVKAPDVSKHLHNFKKWQRKWFQLDTSGDLYFFDNEKTSKPLGVIHLRQCTRLLDGKSQGVQTSFCCGLETNDTIFYLKAESAKIYRDWIKVMSEFAHVCEVDIEALEDRSGSVIGAERRGTLPDDSRRGTLSEEGRRGTFLSDRERAGSVQSRHLSVSSMNKFQTKEGWLAKTGSNNKGWKDRYFRLKNGKLFYYKDNKTETTLGDIDLFNCTSVENAHGKKGHGINLNMPGRVYNLSAESADSCDEWTAMLSHTLTLISDIKDPSTHSIPRTSSTTSTHSAHSSGSRDITSADTPIHAERDEQVVGSGVKVEDKDSVVQLLEAEVEALRDKLVSLQSDLKANTVHNNQLQQQLSEAKRSHSMREKELLDEKEQLFAQVSRLEKSKQELETVNDSVQTQLEEQYDKVQELEEELLGVRQDLEEAHTNNTAIEEDLSDTQQRLQEIEQVAQELEAALRKRESEPATPLSTSFKGLPSLLEDSPRDKTRVTVEEAAFRLKEETQPTSSESEAEIKQKVSQLTQDKEDLALQVKSLQTSLAEAESKQLATNNDYDCSKELDEERLKCQMEMENLRRELNSGFEQEREAWVEERRGLESTLGELKERVESQPRVAELEEHLSASQARVGELENEVESGREKLSQLQVQKEKAVSDLIALRKTNKSMEKRMSESEDMRGPSPMNSLSVSPCRPDTPEVSCRVVELEQILEQRTATLTEVQNERDLLKAKVDRLTSGLQSTPDFGFKFKSGASVVGSNITSIGNNGPSLTNGNAPSSDNVSEASNSDVPPPKPKRPPKELITKVGYTDQLEEVPLETKIRTRTASFFKSIKTIMM